jgi:hypothetical protein
LTETGLVAGLRGSGIAANLRFTGDASDVIFVERRVGARRVYFLHNRASEPRDASFVAPVLGGAQRWDAMAGTIGAQSAFAAGPGGTRVPLPLAPQASALIVIDPAMRPRSVALPQELGRQPLPTSGWSLRVAGHVSGGAALDRQIGEVALGDWSGVSGLAAFSGVGTYARSITLPSSWIKPGTRVTLELGKVHDMATVTVNGRQLPPVVSAPWSIDITAAARPGSNQIEIAVANVPQNAMTGSKAPGFKALTPVPAGLVGPLIVKATR